MNKIKFFFLITFLAFCSVFYAQDSSNTASDSQSFHGKRMSSDQANFEVVFISTEREGILLGFSKPVNPQSFTAEDILLNGNPLAKDTELKFNKTGKFLKIEKNLPADQTSVLAFTKILSFDNQSLETSEFTELKAGEVKHYSLR